MTGLAKERRSDSAAAADLPIPHDPGNDAQCRVIAGRFGRGVVAGNEHGQRWDQLAELLGEPIVVHIFDERVVRKEDRRLRTRTSVRGFGPRERALRRQAMREALGGLGLQAVIPRFADERP